MEVLSDLERLRVSVVLEDCLEQLAILGRSLPTSSKPSFGDIRSSRSEMRGDHLGDMTSDHSMTRDLDETTFSTTDGLLKVQWDRQFAEAVIKDTLQEVRSTGTFHKLLQAVEMEMDQKAGLQDIIASEEESRQRIKLLQRKLQEIREEKEQEVQRRNEMIAHLKDQRQEKKAKMILEEKYTKKNAELQVFQEQKRCQEQEQDLKNQIEHLKNKTAEELIVHKEMEEFLKKYQTELQEKLEMWMDKYDKDIELKQRELNLLRNSRSNNLAEMQKLAKQFSEYEAVVIQDRREREEEQRKLEQEEREYKASVKIQAWWRGVMVRKGFGPFRKGKQKGGKKGKGKGKGKGGKKKK